MTKVMILWFVLLSPDLPGYIEPIEVTAAACSAPSTTPGTLVYDREVNPRRVSWANCEVDVRARVATLTPGVYELATTGLGVPGFEAPDPHTAGPVVIGEEFEQGTGAAKPSDRFSWDMEAPNLATAQGYRFELELDAVVQGTPLAHTCTGAGPLFQCSAPIPAVTPAGHTARVRAVDMSVPTAPITGDWSDPLNFTMRATPAKPGTLRITPATP